MESYFGIVHKFGAVHHPQSQSKVERAKGKIKHKLAKVMAETHLNWLQAIPIVLHDIRKTPSQGGCGLTPFQLQMGRGYNHPAGGLTPLRQIPRCLKESLITG